MAKRNEFKPDKLRSSFLSKLYMTPLQRKEALKWALYALALLVLSVLQDVVFCRIKIFRATTDLVPCGIFLICVLQGMEAGGLFSLIASLCYLFSGTAPGAYCVVLITFLAIGVSFFRQGYLQKGFSAAVLCTAIAVFLYEMLLFAIGVFLGHTSVGRLGVFCLTGLFSVIVIPILYTPMKLIGTIGGDAWKE